MDKLYECVNIVPIDEDLLKYAKAHPIKPDEKMFDAVKSRSFNKPKRYGLLTVTMAFFTAFFSKIGQ